MSFFFSSFLFGEQTLLVSPKQVMKSDSKDTAYFRNNNMNLAKIIVHRKKQIRRISFHNSRSNLRVYYCYRSQKTGTFQSIDLV